MYGVFGESKGRLDERDVHPRGLGGGQFVAVRAATHGPSMLDVSRERSRPRKRLSGECSEVAVVEDGRQMVGARGERPAPLQLANRNVAKEAEELFPTDPKRAVIHPRRRVVQREARVRRPAGPAGTPGTRELTFSPRVAHFEQAMAHSARARFFVQHTQIQNGVGVVEL